MAIVLQHDRLSLTKFVKINEFEMKLFSLTKKWDYDMGKVSNTSPEWDRSLNFTALNCLSD